LPWERVASELAPDLQLVAKHQAEGELRLDAKGKLDNMSVWQGMKERSEVNYLNAGKIREVAKETRP